MLSQSVFLVLVLLVAVQRGVELRLSRRNELLLRGAGAREHAPGQLLVMQLLHGAWFGSMLLEVKLLHAPFQAWLGAAAALVFVVGQLLRYTAIRTLGWRWSVRILTLPGSPPVSAGIYRHVRHPNYLGVALEIAALPLVHSAWRTALIFSFANALLLAARIAAEERALAQSGGYDERFGELRRLWPRFRARGAP